MALEFEWQWDGLKRPGRKLNWDTFEVLGRYRTSTYVLVVANSIDERPNKDTKWGVLKALGPEEELAQLTDELLIDLLKARYGNDI